MTMRIGEVDRFLLPLGARHPFGYLVDALYVAHGTRERLSHLLLNGLPQSVAERLMVKHDRSHKSAHVVDRRSADLEAIQMAVDDPDLLRETPLEGISIEEWIAVRSYPTDRRDRVVVFLFETGRDQPRAVLKLRRSSAPGTSLGVEFDGLRFVRSRLSESMKSTVPEPWAVRTLNTIEVLLLSPLPGRSAYVEMQTRLRPSRRVSGHFRHAAKWLVEFHNATMVPSKNGAPLVASGHGDFWPRNILHDGTAVAVVDWEHFRVKASPFDDLFHYPLTYGLAYPWSRYQRAKPERAFRKTFLEDNPVSAHVRRYFSDYCAATEVEPAELRGRFHDFLATRSWQQTRFNRLLTEATWTVFDRSS